MSRTPLLALVVAAVAVCATIPFVAESSEKAPAEKASAEKTLNGTYNWSNGASGDLRAVFKPTGAKKWNVDFHFKFQGEPHTYSGTAEGDLGAGALTGQVQNEGKNRTFTFQGAFADGKFEGKHSEMRGGEPQPTGTLTLGS